MPCKKNLRSISITGLGVAATLQSKAVGLIFGGCFAVYLHLAGTKHWLDYRNRILLLENPMGEKMEDIFSLIST